MKITNIFLTAVTLLTGFATSVNAAGLSTRIEQPRSPINTKNFQVDFVALDIEGRPVSVECFVKGPGGAFTKFDSKSLVNGGSSGVCQVNESDITTVGTYDFYVKALAGSDTEFSPIVSVNFDDKSPGTPTNYISETINSCEYRIKFRTASDSGVTNKVFLYRSDQSSYSADNSTKVAEISMGSDMNGEFTNTVPNCNKKYYYSIRAFSSSGTGSGITGDPDAVVLGTTTQTSSESTGSAKTTKTSQVVKADNSGKVLGEDISEYQTDSSIDGVQKNPSVLGEEDARNTSKDQSDDSDSMTLWIVGSVSTGLVLLIMLSLFLIRKYGNK